MKEHPILFSAPLVRAILAGRKMQTRRVMKPQPSAGVRNSVFVPSGLEDGHGRELHCPYGQPGDRLWVRETFKNVASGAIRNGTGEIRYGIVYKADAAVIWKPRPTIIHDLRGFDTGPMQFEQRPWHPSIHMPRWASRITLEITDVRVQRVQDISEEDARAEGALPLVEADGSVTCGRRKTVFRGLWDSIYAARGYGWATNPWVWAVTFKRVEQSA